MARGRCLAAIAAGLAVIAMRSAWPGGSRRPVRGAADGRPGDACPPVTILKPLHGDEPLLEEALAASAAQDYPVFQVVFGVQDPADPALPVVRRLQSRFPGRDLALVVDPTAARAQPQGRQPDQHAAARPGTRCW